MPLKTIKWKNVEQVVLVNDSKVSLIYSSLFTQKNKKKMYKKLYLSKIIEI